MKTERAEDLPKVRPQPAMAVLRSCATGWYVDLQDASGQHVLNSAVYPSKFLAEEALAAILARAGK